MQRQISQLKSYIGPIHSLHYLDFPLCFIFFEIIYVIELFSVGMIYKE